MKNKVDPHERLMRARIAVAKAANTSDKYATNILLAAIDQLFFEVDLLIYALEDTKIKPAKRRPHAR